MLITGKRRTSRMASSRMMPIVILLVSALFGTICSIARAQGPAADNDVLQGPPHGYDLLRGPRIQPHDAAGAGADYAPRRDFGTGDANFPAYGAPPDDGGLVPDDPGAASEPAYSRPRFGDPPLSQEDGGSHSSYKLQPQPGARRRADDSARSVSQIEKRRTRRAIDLQRDYTLGRISRQSLDAGTAQIVQQANEAIAQRRRSLSR